jgi:hypothetical protein
MAMAGMPGIALISNSSRFAINSLMNRVTPVMLLLGRLRLATTPNLTTSSPITKTIGIVDVAALAASAETAPPLATMTVT